MPRRWTNGPGLEPKNYLNLLAELNPRAAAATRRSGRMHPQSGPDASAPTRSAAHTATTRRTHPTEANPRGRAFASLRPDPLPTSSGSDSSLPGEGTPSRARGEAARG